MKNVFIKCFLAISCLVLLTSCSSKKLTNGIAKDAIVTEEGYPKVVSYEFNKSYLKDFYSTGRGVTANLGEGFDKVKNVITYFEQNGLVIVTEESKSETTTAFLIGETTRTWVYAVIELTEKGKEYLIRNTEDGYSVKIWENDFDQITGIQIFKEQNYANVNYNEKKTNVTPFGNAFTNKNDIVEQTVNFSFYEDGWRIE